MKNSLLFIISFIFIFSCNLGNSEVDDDDKIEDVVENVGIISFDFDGLQLTLENSIELEWNIADNAIAYQIQIAPSSQSIENSEIISINDNSYIFTSEDYHHFQWRVRGVGNTENLGEWSTTNSIMLDFENYKPTELSHGGDSILTDSTPTFKWKNLNGITSMEMQISDSELLLPYAEIISVPLDEYTPNYALTNQYIYYWRVRAIYDSYTSEWSDSITFTLNWGIDGPDDGICYASELTEIPSTIGTYILGNNIDMSDIDWSPLGSWSEPFSGTIDGNGYTISNLTVNNNSYSGLIGVLDGTVKNLNFDNVNLSGSYSGGVAARVRYGASISNCSVEGSINGELYAGGIVGHADEVEIDYCISTATINGLNSSGGIVGRVLDSFRISNCAYVGTISGNDYVGGIAGYLYDSGYIKKSFSDAIITSNSSTVFLGGIAGTTRFVTIENCYSNSSITVNADDARVGGIIGHANESTDIKKVYVVGDISVTGNSSTSGAFYGTSSNGGVTVYNSFSDNNLDSEELKEETLFTDANWDFVGELSNGSEEIWEIDQTRNINSGYPFLVNFLQDYIDLGI